MVANPYGGLVSSLDADGFEALCSAVAERRCRALIGAGTLAEAAELWRPSPPCPSCGFPDCSRDGKTPAGRQRWRCPRCGEAFSALTGTVLESSNKELPVWERFITCMCYNAPVDLAAEVCGIAHTTAFEWRHRVFATVDGYQDRLVLRGARLDRRALPHRLRHRPQRGLRAQEGPVEEQDLHRGGHRRLQERRRGHMRPRQALLKAHQGRAAVAHSARFRHRPRHGEGPHEPREGRQVHRRGVQGRREGPCVPGGDGAREQPVLVAQALPIPLPRDEEGQPAVLPELVRVPVPRPTRRGEMAQNGKGHAPFAYDRCALPQLKVGIGPARFATLGI